MAKGQPISGAQLRMLQTLYSRLAAQDPIAQERDQRLLWASILCNRAVLSFNQLSRQEAKRCIDQARQQVPPAVVQRPAKHLDFSEQTRARRHGVDGRKDNGEFRDAPQIAEGPLVEEVQSYARRLGWSQAQFESWLRSPRSPLRGQTAIRTVAQVNRVRWALRHMLQQRGLWVKKSATA